MRRRWRRAGQVVPADGAARAARRIHPARGARAVVAGELAAKPGGALVPIGGDDVRWQPNADGPGRSGAGPRHGGLRDAGGCHRRLARPRAPAGSRSAAVTRALARLSARLPGAGHAAACADARAQHDPVRASTIGWSTRARRATSCSTGRSWTAGRGRRPPYYGQPLYPYVLALAHWLTGEGLFGPLALQFAALGLVMVGRRCWRAARSARALDGLVGRGGRCWRCVQLETEHLKVARQLFNENLYMPLVMASLIVLVGLARGPRRHLVARAAGRRAARADGDQRAHSSCSSSRSRC